MELTAGFNGVRPNASHLVMKRGSKSCVVPMPAEVKLGTLAGLLRQAEVSPEEFMRAAGK